MKPITTYITEKLIIKKNKNTDYKYFPKTKDELQYIIKKRINEEGNEVDLNDIDMSKITDTSELFYKFYDFNGDISKWDVSNVTNMREMFFGCKSFNRDISNWDVSNVSNMEGMFAFCGLFNQDISNWDVSNVTRKYGIFTSCKIEEKYKPNFK